MADIQNTEYITINKDGIFVGGKPATTYFGKEIWSINDINYYFQLIQKFFPNVMELHAISSIIGGKFAIAGNPGGGSRDGNNIYCRVRYQNNELGSWIFHSGTDWGGSCVKTCENMCAIACVQGFCFYGPKFRATLLGQSEQAPVINDFQKVAFAQFYAHGQKTL